MNSRHDLDDMGILIKQCVEGYKLQLHQDVAPSVGRKEEMIVMGVEEKEPINYVK